MLGILSEELGSVLITPEVYLTLSSFLLYLRGLEHPLLVSRDICTHAHIPNTMPPPHTMLQKIQYSLSLNSFQNSFLALVFSDYVTDNS